MDLKTASICHNKNHPLWGSAIPLIFYINQNQLLRFSWKGDWWQTWYILYFHIFSTCNTYLPRGHSHPLSLGFVREIDLAEGFNLWFSTGFKNRQWSAVPQLWQSGMLPFQGWGYNAVTYVRQSTGTNSALGIYHPTWKQVIQCWSLHWQGWTAQISLWLFPTCLEVVTRNFLCWIPAGERCPRDPEATVRHWWKAVHRALERNIHLPPHTHTYSPRLTALTNLLEAYRE